MLKIVRWILLVALLFPYCLAYVVTTEPWQTNRPAPGNTMRYDIQYTEGEVVLVDIILISASRGNTTTIFSAGDLSKTDNANATFSIPFVPPGMYMVRLVDTSTKQFLADSSQFEIFAVGTASASSSSASSIPPTTLPTFSSTTSAPSSSNTAGGANSDTSSGSSTPIGAIVGGVLGGLLLLGILAIVLWRRRRVLATGRRTSREDASTSEVNLATVQPYTLAPRQVEALGAPIDPEGSSIHPSIMSPSPGVTRQPIPLAAMSKAQLALGGGYGVGANSSVSVTAPMSPESRTEMLRRERERINREIAALENRTDTSGSQGTASMSLATSSTLSGTARDLEITAQLEALRSQIRQMEERQGYGTTNAIDFEPPPGYDAPPAPPPIPEPSTTTSEESRPLPTPRVQLGDRKERR